MQKSHSRKQFALRALSAAVIAACAAPALALDFKTESGWEGNVKTDLSVSQSWRVEAPDKRLIGTGAADYVYGSHAGYGTHADASGSINWARGDRYETMFKFITELSVSKGDMGGLFRVKGWYDDAAKNHNVKYGNEPSRFARGNPLSDDTFEPLARFDGIELLDAYVYNTFDVGGRPTQVRLGRQAVNWGESIFIQGVNQLSPIDLAALNKAGTQIKEALIPVWSLNLSVGLGNGMSAEAFYQFKYEQTNLEGCGTYFGGDGGDGSPGKCSIAKTVGVPFAFAALDRANLVPGYIPFVAHDGPKDGGQWGLAFRFPVESIDTEFGLYAMNIHSRIPFLSGDTRGATVNGGTSLTGVTTYYEFPEDIRIYGVSAATTMAGWSLGAEISHTPNLPVQLNPADALYGLFLGQGPLAKQFGANDVLLYAGAAQQYAAGAQQAATGAQQLGAAAQAAAAAGNLAQAAALGAQAQAAVTQAQTLAAQAKAAFAAYTALSPIPDGKKALWERTHKTQVQFNALNTLPAMWGATGGLFIAEAGFQWAGISDSNGTNKRYGRAIAYDGAIHSAYDLALIASDPTNCPPTENFISGCKNDGFMTRFSWGYRLNASLTYPGFMGTGWEFRPGIFWAHDVKGYSVDYQFAEDRKTLSLTAGFNLNNMHSIELNYTAYSNDAEYNLTRDRDNASIVYRYTF